METHRVASKLSSLCLALLLLAGASPGLRCSGQRRGSSGPLAFSSELRFARAPLTENEIGDTIHLEWTSGVPNAEFRYKLDMPGDWMGGIRYARNKWSPYSTVRQVTFRDFVLEGDYTFTVEDRIGEKITSRFRMNFVMPDILEEAASIDWNRVRAAPGRAEKFRVLSAEYGQACSAWTARYEAEARKLRLSSDMGEIQRAVSASVVGGGQTLLLRWADQEVSATLGKILAPKLLSDIVNQIGVDFVLLYRNRQTNRAAFSAITACWAAEGYRRLAASSPSAAPEFPPPPPDVTSSAPDAIDLIFCIDTTYSMTDDIRAVKSSASRMIAQVFAVSSSPRLALVAYRDYGSDYVTKGFPFTTDKEVIRRNILSLTLQRNNDNPEAVYEGLLHAIHTRDLGPWRNGVKKIIILMGDAPPHTKRYHLADVVKAAAEVDPAHVFPIAIAGANRRTLSSFSEIAQQTGGVMTRTSSAAELPRKLIEMVELGSRLSDVQLYAGKVTERIGDSVRIRLDDSAPDVLPGTNVLIFSESTPGLLIADGAIFAGGGRSFTVELNAEYGTEQVTAGCGVRIQPAETTR